MRFERTRKNHFPILKEASSKKSVIDLAITKCLTRSPLRPEELRGLLEVTQSELLKSYGLDLYMAEQVKLHTLHEQNRLRAQNLFARSEETSGLYPEVPYTRTSPMKESRLRTKLAECGDWGEEEYHGEDDYDDGRMLDYGEVMSDSGEGRMARQAFKSIADDANELYDLLNDADDLPSWCEYYASEAEHIMSVLRKYLSYKIDNPERSTRSKLPLTDKLLHGEE